MTKVLSIVIISLCFFIQCKPSFNKTNDINNTRITSVDSLKNTLKEESNIPVNSPLFLKDSLVLKVIKELNLPKDSIHINFASKKTLQFTPNKTVIVIPVVKPNEYNFLVFDLHVVLLNTKKHRIISSYKQDASSLDQGGEEVITNIDIIDNRSFKIHQKEFSFGISLSYDGISEGKKLYLLTQKKNKLLKIYDFLIENKETEMSYECNPEIPCNEFISNLSISPRKTNGYFNIKYRTTSKNYIVNHKKCTYKEVIEKSFDLFKFSKKTNHYYGTFNKDNINYSFKKTKEKAIILPNNLAVEYPEYNLKKEYKNTNNLILNVEKKTNVIRLNYEEPCDGYSFVYINSFPIKGWINGRHVYKINNDKNLIFHLRENSYIFTPAISYSDVTTTKRNCSVDKLIVFQDNNNEYEGLIRMVNNELYSKRRTSYFKLKNNYRTSDKIQHLETEGDKLILTVLRKQKKSSSILTFKLFSKDNLYYAELTNKKKLTKLELKNYKAA